MLLFYSISGWYSYLWLPFISLFVSILPSILHLFSSNSCFILHSTLSLLYNADNSIGGNKAPCHYNSYGIDNSRKGSCCEGCSGRSASGWPVLVWPSTTYSLPDPLCSLYGTIFNNVIYVSTNNLFSFLRKWHPSCACRMHFSLPSLLGPQ